MAILRIVYFPDDPLTREAAPVETFGPNLEKLAADMLETMHAYQGVGLAAPQVGVSKQMFVLQEPDGPEMALVNPEILLAEGKEDGEEGCLSMPQVYAMVPRATHIRVRAHDVKGEPLEFDAEDFLARVIQHELDHLNGVLFPDRLDIITRQAKLQEWAEVREQLLSPVGGEDTGHAT